VAPGGITQPVVGIFVFDFAQNMAGQTQITVTGCPAGTLITMYHAEILFPDGTVNNNYGSKSPMRQEYYCAGTGGTETYRTHFSYYGFRYVQVAGFPGVPGENAITAYFIHSEFAQAGEFSSSSQLLNRIQHATRYASWSNLMDVPTDCPQRERRGWLGDAQLSFETVIHNIDGGAFYTKWLNDFADTQVYDNETYHSDGALPDCVPFYGHGHVESDPGWGIAAWTITDWFSDYYADDVFDKAWYPNMKWYMDHWVAIAEKNQGYLNVFWWGDWGNYVPGPYKFKTPDYPQFFYITALDITAKFASRLGFADDVVHYSGLAKAARVLYQKAYYSPQTKCYGAVVQGMAPPCTYVSQLMALTLGLAPAGSAEEAAVWAHAMDWWRSNTTKGVPEHFGPFLCLEFIFDVLFKINT
jgi:alpha-L-rhamnosidase